MVVSTFLSGAVFGALIATLLSRADPHHTLRIPLSLDDALLQIKLGWAKPTAMAWSIIRHPAILLMALLLLGFRRVAFICVASTLDPHAHCG